MNTMHMLDLALASVWGSLMVIGLVYHTYTTIVKKESTAFSMTMALNWTKIVGSIWGILGTGLFNYIILQGMMWVGFPILAAAYAIGIVGSYALAPLCAKLEKEVSL